MEPHGPIELKALLAHLEGMTPRDEVADMEQLLATSDEARRSLDELEALLAEVARPDPALAGVDLTEDVRRAVLQEPRRPGASRWRRAALLALAAGLVTLALGLWHRLAAPTLPQPARDTFRARHATVQVSHEDRWAGVKVFHKGASGEPLPLGWQLPANHGLLVAYSNLGPRPHSHLMVFAVDHGGEVYWVHPAHERPGSDPSSISIRSGADVELSHIVTHRLRQGPLAIYGLFSRRPLKVSAVEGMIRNLRRRRRWRAGAPPRLPVKGAAQHVLRPWVVP